MEKRKVKFTWDIHYKCNFRCPYCWFYRDWARLSSQNLYLSVDEWMVHWKRIYDKYGEARIEIVGGEPFIYPDFIELVKRLSALHRVKITTNLSGNIEKFVQEISPERVDLDLNLHILFIDLETVIKKTLMLKNAGFKAGICYLAYPPQMHKIPYFSERFKKEGINFALAAFWGEYAGKKYPDSYTQEEREMMRPYIGDLGRSEYHLGGKSPKGKLCKAGYAYGDIRANGNIVRCGQMGEKIIGNITDKDFNLLEGPSLCESEFCSCNEYDNIIEKEEDNCGIRVERPDAKEEKAAVALSVAPYRVHWNWEITMDCNYRCSYCEVPKKKEGPAFSLDRLEEIWERIFKKYGVSHVRLSGGEPSTYPDFYGLISLLSRRHVIDITTNLSFDVHKFGERFKGESISISASFHPEFNKIEDFVAKVKYLQGCGFCATITCVTYPPFINEIERFKRVVEESRINFKTIPFNGLFEGRRYPLEYSRDELKRMKDVAEQSIASDVNKRWYDWLTKPPDERTRGEVICRMGQMYAKIFTNGDVTRCCAQGSEKLGNLGDEGFKLLEGAQACTLGKCPCFKAMLVGIDEEKWIPLWTTLDHKRDPSSAIVLK